MGLTGVEGRIGVRFVRTGVHQQIYLHPPPKQTIKMSNPFRINAEKVREHNSRKTSFSKWQARYEPDE